MWHGGVLVRGLSINPGNVYVACRISHTFGHLMNRNFDFHVVRKKMSDVRLTYSHTNRNRRQQIHDYTRI